MLLTFCSFPFLMHIHHGQSDVFVVVLILWSWLAYARGGWLVASGLLALATLLKVNPSPLLIYFVLYRRDWHFLVGFLATLVLTVLVSLAFVPASLYRDYVLDVLPTVARGTGYWRNQSLLRFLPAQGSRLAPIVTAVGFGLFAAFAAWVSRRHPEAQRRLAWPLGAGPWHAEGMFVMNLAVILVFSGKSWSMAYVWMILPMALLLTHLLHQPVRWWFRAAAAFATLLLLAKVYGYPLLDSLNLVGSLLLLVLLGLWSLRRDGLLSGSP